jgi:uncharacterized protein YjbI with pentapeptide repeats
MMTRTMTVTACLCLAMALCAFADDKKKKATGEIFTGDQTGAQFSGRNFKDNSTFEDCDCAKVDFSKAIAKEAVFVGADLSMAYFYDTDLSKADFRNAKMDYTQMGRAILTGANLEGVNMSTVGLIDAKLSDANLKGLKGIGEVYSANFVGADVRGANLSKMAFGNNTKPNFRMARYDAATRWPAGFDPVDAGAVLTTEEKPK